MKILDFIKTKRTKFNILSIDNYRSIRTFAMWFFHNSIRFKVNKVG